MYSDVPHRDAELIDAGDLQTYQALRPPASVRKPQPKLKAIGYKSVRVVSPTNDTTFRDNSDAISVAVALMPLLQTGRGHRLVLLMDGTRQGGPSLGTTFQLTNVDRGSHTLVVQVVDKNNKLLASSPSVTFHMHRTSVK